MKKVSLVLGMLAVFAVCASPTRVSSAERVLIPQQTLLPLYVVGLGHTGPGPDDWVATAFYYPPDQIPVDYSFWNAPVFNPPVGTVAPYVEGFLVTMDSDNPATPPRQLVLHNAPGALVPIWFTPAQNFLNGVDGIPPFSWSINSMLAEGSLIGWADFYQEADELKDQSRPSGPWHSVILASGVMEDGRRFWLQSEISLGYFINPHTYDLKVHFGP